MFYTQNDSRKAAFGVFFIDNTVNFMFHNNSTEKCADSRLQMIFFLSCTAQYSVGLLINYLRWVTKG